MHIVIIEWDGKTPPTTYYNRMHKLGLYVRGDKDERNPLLRRTPDHLKDTGLQNIIFQEGCVVCSSEKLARTVATYARTNGAKNVQVIQGFSVVSAMTPEDVRIFAQLEDKLGQRGRPTGEKTPWVVTCYEECISNEIDDQIYAVNCPSCHSPYMNARPGNAQVLAIPDGDVIDAWYRHRFATGMFEVPDSPSDCTTLPPDASGIIIASSKEQSVVDKIRSSKRLIDEIAKLPDRKIAMRMLDAVFCGRAYIGESVRHEARLRVALSLYERGVDQSKVSIMESKDEYDILDGSHIDPVRLAGLWLSAINA